MNKYLTAEELANRWRVKRKKIYKMREEKQIPFTRIGGNYRFPLDAIEKYEQGNTIIPDEDEERQE